MGGEGLGDVLLLYIISPPCLFIRYVKYLDHERECATAHGLYQALRHAGNQHVVLLGQKHT